ncbi:MAG: GAF domain-containing protein, partial [Pirellulales bacterium]
SSTLRSSDNRFYRVHAAPLVETEGPPRNLVVTIRDVTAEVLQQQKLAAIHQAGIELANLTPDELFHMTVEERIELLKSNILHYTRDLLNFNVVEIRLLDSKTGRLEPLLSEGLVPEATDRALYAQPQNNGVTGFVAATGKSYLCEDTTEDPLYLEGAKGAKSSLTVPLVLHDEVIGTFNVESPEPRAFSESDLQFLEIFTRDVALALNTLELLVAEKASTAAESVEAIHSAVALPVDDILNDAVNILERYIGHEPEVAERLQRVLRNARDIKQVIQKVGQQMAPSQAHPQALHYSERPLLRGLQVLVADADESVRSAAHALLERYGCVVETAHDGGEAIFMV